jgi:SAM-dependent methyltransferase
MDGSRFDRDYYRRYYGDARTRVTSVDDTARLARFVVGYLGYLGLEPRSVLDVGCGIGLWKSALKALLPRARYVGLEVSEHVAAEHGWVHGSVTSYRGAPVDLVICQGVLQYVPDAELPKAIASLARLSGRGALYLEALTKRDWAENADQSVTDGAVHLRPASRYRTLLREAGLRACGGGVYLGPKSTAVLYELEEGRDR